jgi:hypothetical protein
VVINDYPAPHTAKKGFPEGHIELRNFLAVPVFDDGRVVAVAEVGNKNTDYDWSDVRQLALLMAGVWPIILRKRAEEALQQAKLQAELYVDLMGHDINNMNQIAIGFLELALQTLDTDKALTAQHRFLLEKPVDTLYNSARLIKNVKKLKNAQAEGDREAVRHRGRRLERHRAVHERRLQDRPVFGVRRLRPDRGGAATARWCCTRRSPSREKRIAIRSCFSAARRTRRR